MNWLTLVCAFSWSLLITMSVATWQLSDEMYVKFTPYYITNALITLSSTLSLMALNA
ncbi:hypothetical protein [Maritalea porphyrae]|uniref:hypothetical protein n=1 Tax=Maritalea porphyrae TaxID=880732 RepID=UPI0022B03425|nr:hypothetical protein [Maritalea porphyrae]MCZ4270912.1 hypothetical protein [Maritalea porphyrae]